MRCKGGREAALSLLLNLDDALLQGLPETHDARESEARKEDQDPLLEYSAVGDETLRVGTISSPETHKPGATPGNSGTRDEPVEEEEEASISNETPPSPLQSGFLGDRFLIGHDANSEAATHQSAGEEDMESDSCSPGSLTSGFPGDTKWAELLHELSTPRPLLKHSKDCVGKPHMRYACLNPRSKQFEWSSAHSGTRHRQGKLLTVTRGISASLPEGHDIKPEAVSRMFHIEVVKSKERARVYHFTAPTDYICNRWVEGLTGFIELMARR